MEASPSFTSLEARVFSEQNGVIFIGTQKIPAEIRDLLREQAKYLQTSQLWEIVNATLTDEASKIALIQSTDFDQVRFAKALYHWNHVMKNMIKVLAK